MPNADRAVVDERKLTEYILSRSHPIGRFKAAVFAAAGFDVDSWPELAAQIRAVAIEGEAEGGARSEFGQKYLISGTLTGPHGARLAVVTVWIVLSADDTPRLVTVYPR